MMIESSIMYIVRGLHIQDGMRRKSTFINIFQRQTVKTTEYLQNKFTLVP